MKKAELIENLKYGWEIHDWNSYCDEDKFDTYVNKLTSFTSIFNNLINQMLEKPNIGDKLIENYTNVIRSFKNIGDFIRDIDCYRKSDYGYYFRFNDDDEEETLETLIENASKTTKEFYHYLLNLIIQEIKLDPYLIAQFQETKMLKGFDYLNVAKYWLIDITKNTNIAKNGIILKQSNQQTKSKQSSNKNSSKIKI